MAPPEGFNSTLIDCFLRWKADEVRESFVLYLKRHVSRELKNWILKGNLRKSLANAGINPDVHLRSRLSRDLVLERMPQIIRELAEIVGVGQLNDRAMHSTDKIPIPKSLSSGGVYELSEKFGEKARITKQALQKKLVGYSGKSWAAILAETGYLESNKKVAFRSFEETVALFSDFIQSNNDVWTKQSLRQDGNEVSRAAYNLTERMENAGVPVEIKNDLQSDPIFVLWSIATALQKGETHTNGAIARFIREKEFFSEQFFSQHASENKWSQNQLQRWVLERYAAGLPLNRQSLEHDSDPKVRSAVYSLRLVSRKGESKDFDLKRHGVLLTRLQEKLKEIEQPYSPGEALGKFRSLVQKCISTGINCLSREWVQRHEPQFAAVCLNKFNNDWSKALAAHGLDPTLFSMHASARSKRGIVFQMTLREVLLDSGFEEALDDESILQNNQFVYNRSISQCSHLRTGCRPDFVFKDLIIDTKVGGSLAKPAQLERYLDHRSKVVVVTANDRPKTIDLRNGRVVILGLKEFIDQDAFILGHSLAADALSRLKASLTVRSPVRT